MTPKSPIISEHGFPPHIRALRTAAHREGAAELAEPPLEAASEALFLLRLLGRRPLAADDQLPLVLARLHLRTLPGEPSTG